MILSDKLAQLIPRARPYNVGLWVPMINDHKRNALYNNIIKGVVQGKTCADIGFGSGILTMMAVHHGAAHVYAYEPDPTTFEFGKHIISEMGFANNVTFINDYFDNRFHTDIAIHEMLWRSVWGEGLYGIYSQLKHTDTLITPARIRCEIVAAPSGTFETEVQDIDPGIEYLGHMNSIWNSIIESDKYACYNNIHSSKWLLGNFTTHLAEYTYNLNTDDIPEIIQVEVYIPEPCSVTCKFSINDMIISDGHWKADKIIEIKDSGKKTFYQRTSDGNWWFE
jgi:hypothetical protein